MRPSDHPEFFRLPAPEGRSRREHDRARRGRPLFHEARRSRTRAWPGVRVLDRSAPRRRPLHPEQWLRLDLFPRRGRAVFRGAGAAPGAEQPRSNASSFRTARASPWTRGSGWASDALYAASKTGVFRRDSRGTPSSPFGPARRGRRRRRFLGIRGSPRRDPEHASESMIEGPPEMRVLVADRLTEDEPR